VLNLRYPGQYFDAETGTNYNMFRTYEPATGRYLQSDPAGLLGGISTYAYVTNNSLNYYDSYGLSGASTGAAWGAAIGGGIGVLGAGAATWATAGGNAPFIAPETAWAIGAGTTIGAAIGAAIGNDSGASGAYAQAPDNAYDPNGPKAPGKPGPAEGFIDPKGGENWIPNPFPGRGGASHGWEDSKGRVWCPTGQGGRAHGGPHWDVQDPKTGGNTNVPPGININDL
jgi:RHS repeat-associated protein